MIRKDVKCLETLENLCYSMCPSCGIISCEFANATVVENHRTLNRVLVAIARFLTQQSLIYLS